MRVLFVTVKPVLRLDVGNDFPIPAIGSDVVVEDIYYIVTSHVWEYEFKDSVMVTPTVAIHLKEQ